MDGFRIQVVDHPPSLLIKIILTRRNSEKWQSRAVDRLLLVDTLKAMPLTITGTMGLDWAVISDGGVDLKEVDTKTMASRLVPNVYLTGDVLHINRPSGGYGLQLAWTTGYVAGQAA